MNKYPYQYISSLITLKKHRSYNNQLTWSFTLMKIPKYVKLLLLTLNCKWCLKIILYRINIKWKLAQFTA